MFRGARTIGSCEPDEPWAHAVAAAAVPAAAGGAGDVADHEALSLGLA